MAEKERSESSLEPQLTGARGRETNNTKRKSTSQLPTALQLSTPQRLSGKGRCTDKMEKDQENARPCDIAQAI